MCLFAHLFVCVWILLISIEESNPHRNFKPSTNVPHGGGSKSKIILTVGLVFIFLMYCLGDKPINFQKCFPLEEGNPIVFQGHGSRSLWTLSFCWHKNKVARRCYTCIVYLFLFFFDFSYKLLHFKLSQIWPEPEINFRWDFFLL